MIITLFIYSLIFIYIIIKGLYIFFKSFSNNQKIKIEKFNDSINLISIPFYINMHNINLLCIFVNLFLIYLIFLPNLMNDIIISIFNSNITYCQDYISDEESSSDDDWGLGLPIDRNSGESSSDDEERNRQLQHCTLNKNNISWSNIEDDIYMVKNNHPFLTAHFFRGYNYEHDGIFKQLIEQTYKISNINRFFVYHLNSDEIKIQDFLKVFQGFSQNLEDIFNKQNVLLQQIFDMNEESYSLLKIKNMYNEINKRSMDTLILTSTAYEQIMFSYYKSNLSIHYPDNLLFKILNNKTNENEIQDINSIIRDFIGDYQVNNLNEKITNTFNALEQVHLISKKNYDILDERGMEDLRINDNNSLIKIKNIHIPEKNQIKNFNELCNDTKIYKSLVLKDSMRYDNISDNIYDFHNKYYNPIYSKEYKNILNNGFILIENEELSNYYTDDAVYDEYY